MSLGLIFVMAIEAAIVGGEEDIRKKSCVLAVSLSVSLSWLFLLLYPLSNIHI